MNNVMKLAAIAATTGLLATGCATTSVTTTAQAAPITYKIGSGPGQYASLALPKTSNRPAMPRVATPDISGPVGAQGPSFDADRVDRELYSHQKLGKRYTVMGRTFTPRHDPDYDKTGEASWYGPAFHGKPTATGELFDRHALTAAHKTLPLNSMLVVTNVANGRTVTVRLNDRGPFIGNRILDLSEAAAEALDYKADGTATVRVRYAGPADPMAAGRTLPRAAPRLAELPRENVTPAPQPSAGPIPAPYVPEFQAPTVPAPIAPRAAERAPDADLPRGDVTLTIKGPIHIAKSDDAANHARFISERAETPTNR